MSDAEPSGALSRWYSKRIGKPETGDEARGYLLFALGLVLGIVGVGMLVTDDLQGALPETAVILAALSLILLIAGPLIRLPLRRVATGLVYLGALLSLAALPWFVQEYPGWRPVASDIIALYAGGLLVMAIGGVLVPIVSSRAERSEQLVHQERELGDLRRALDDANADEADIASLVSQLRSDKADTAADEADLATQLRSIRSSQGRFELYLDNAGEWRWRLRHRNGNVIATSGEGYTRRHNAQKGLQSVRSNALGATLLLIEAEEEVPDEDVAFDPIAEQESQATFELYEDRGGDLRWRLRHTNGNIIADGGEGYASRSGARNAVDGIRNYAGPAAYLWADPTAIEIYRDSGGEYRWRLIHKNGNILADSGEGYSSRFNARRAIDRIRENLSDMDFETYEDAAGEHRWRLRGGNDQIMADSGEGYASQSNLEDAVERVQTYLPEADLLTIGQATFELFEDAGGDFRWRLRHRNGQILADSSEGYTDRSSARDGIESLKRNAPNAPLDE
jgi:uncharacterized protein YegP (UPF0339 family)